MSLNCLPGQIYKGKDSLHMGEFFLILEAINQAARITCLKTAEEILDKVAERIEVLTPKKKAVLKQIHASKLKYIQTTLKAQVPAVVQMCMAHWDLLDVAKEILSCARGNHMIRKSIYHKTPLRERITA